METEKLIRNTTLLLCFVAGYCDTLTFVAAGEIFSAHVTGNFIVFAYDLIKHTDTKAWQKLLTFPVFIMAIMLSGRIAKRWSNMYTLLLLEALLLLVSGLIALALHPVNVTSWIVQLIVLLIVAAMAFQNTFGKLYGKATYGITTVMTGNVTQFSLDLVACITNKTADAAIWASLKKQTTLIVGFLVGCLAGALMGKQIGLTAILLPAAMMLVWLGVDKIVAAKTATLKG
ncbi:YoaK family protein [Mucilaginibacter flavus]|uniref:YoaK family protein n=1 Tax=Mucilaginibacter flavus TaxID=931504 RepID=UPI0025B38E91|nr:YoaK family protein [Mucilaginibacter flavus]MDN3582396.1 YoaK family protein [Mucilaginibacter flavus]